MIKLGGNGVRNSDNDLRPNGYRAALILLLLVTVLAIQAYFLGERLLDSSGPTSVKGERFGPFKIARISPCLDSPMVQGLEDFQAPTSQFVFVFSPTCPACFRILPVWKRLIEAQQGRKMRFVLISTKTEGAKEFSRYFGLPVLTIDDPRARRNKAFKATPLTLLISPNGKIEEVWAGAVDAKEFAEWIPAEAKAKESLR